jgi:transketolase
MDIKSLKLLSETSRKRLIEIIYKVRAGHTGGDLSCLNVLTVLYNHYLNITPENLQDPDRDRFVLSKGHCVEALDVVFEAKGILSKETVDTLGQFGSPLAGHPLCTTNGVEVNSGALGHGLSFGIGMALAGKKDSRSYKTVVLMGDGEQEEGSIYEAAMAAPHYGLGRLIAIIDRNKLQISGSTEDVMPIESIRKRWEAFGWEVLEMNGDDIADIVKVLDSIDVTSDRPHLVISHTTKGYGVSYMENVAAWHHKVPTQEQYEQAEKEIDERIKEISA